MICKFAYYFQGEFLKKKKKTRSTNNENTLGHDIEKQQKNEDVANKPIRKGFITKIYKQIIQLIIQKLN